MIMKVWGILQSVRFQDILDITIIAFMISIVLIWFKDRASRFVLVGISLLGFVYLIARFFQLYLTTVVLQSFFAILLFVLVVIFQEDLRRFFERLAMWGKIRKKTLHLTPYHPNMEIISQTAANLARKRIGALIVIQGHDPLDRHLQGGTRLDGIVSKSLLESIFDPHSIGHDGAVVINGNRIVQFGCHLPLSVILGKYSNLGLRHTAALGISERSDAICIVVSEEKGTISIAQGEELQEVPNAAALRIVLESFYASAAPTSKTGPFLKLLKENPKEKLVAIALACILWVAFGYQGDSVRRDFIVPIEYLNISPEWVIEEPKIMEAKITLMGPSQAFQLLDPNVLKISFNLSQIQEGKQKIMLTREMVNSPSNLSVVGIKPGQINVVASRMVSIQVPIEIISKNKPPSDHYIYSLTALPQSIKVLVPSKLRYSRIKVKTEPIDLSQVNATREIKAKLIYPPEVRLDGNERDTSSVTVIVKVKKVNS
jgi:uncharacterized protein (TIGR00159 family)